MKFSLLRLGFFMFLLVSWGWGAEPTAQLRSACPEYASLSFSKDSSRLLLFGDNQYWVWDVKSLQPVAHAKVAGLLDASLSADGSCLALGSRPRLLVVQELKSHKVRLQHKGPAVPKGSDVGGYAMAFSPNGAYLVAWGTGFMREAGEPRAYLFQWPGGKLLRSFAIEPQATSCGWTAAGQLTIHDITHLLVCDPVSGVVAEQLVLGQSTREQVQEVMKRLGLLEQFYDENGRAHFIRAPLAYQLTSDRAADGGGTKFYAEGDSRVLGTLAWAGAFALSPDAHSLAVLTRQGVLLLDVDATLASVKAGKPALIAR